MADTIQLQEIKCSNCAGEVQFDPGTQLSICNFCGSTFDIKQAKSVEVIEPDGLIPFKVTRELFNNSVLEWLNEGDFTPDDVLTSSVFNNVAGLYLPFYFFTGEYEADWSASSGYHRKETYTEYVTRTENGRSRQVPVTKTRTVTDWRPSSGKINGSFSELGIASKLLLPDYASFCEEAAWEKGSVKDFDKRFTMGFAMEPFSVSSDDSYDGRVKSKVGLIIDKHVAKVVPGDTKKDVTWTGGIQKKADNIYLPFWLATYKYANNKYSCLLDGQKSNRITGNKPIDEERVKTVKSYFLPFKLITAIYALAVIIPLFSADMRGSAWHINIVMYGLIPVLAAGAVGLYRKSKLINRSKQIRKEILLKIKSSQSGLKEEFISSD